MLDQVVFNVTYESNMDKALNIGLEAAKKHTKAFSHEVKSQPFVRMVFQASGVDIIARYYCPAKLVHDISSRITREIYNKIKESDDVDFAYPHIQLVDKKR